MIIGLLEDVHTTGSSLSAESHDLADRPTDIAEGQHGEAWTTSDSILQRSLGKTCRTH